MQAVTRRLSLLLLLGFEVGAVVLLHRLGSLEWLQIDWSDLNGWLQTSVAEDALAAVIRLIALALGYWMLTTTVLYLGARLVRVPAALRAVEWATIPAVRRVVDGAVAVSIATASIAGPVAPAIAQTPTPVVVQVDDEGHPVPPGSEDDAGGEADGPADTTVVVVPPGLDRIGWTPTPAGVPDTTPTPIGDIVDAAADRLRTGSEATAQAASVVVRSGDHLWSISEQHLAATLGRPVSDPEIAPYWRRVIDLNRDRLRSGDPDLIYPGETVLLPPLDLEDQ